MTAERSDELADSELTDEQRQTLALLNGKRSDLLTGFDEALARRSIGRQVHRFSTRKIAERREDDGCHMACCSCPPPEEACIEDCQVCKEKGGEQKDRPDVVPEEELTEDQRRTRDLLNDSMYELLCDFDEVLARHGIERQVHRFSTVVERSADSECFMLCCACPPPDEACAGECTPCKKPPEEEKD
jgi:hypothetical protein